MKKRLSALLLLALLLLTGCADTAASAADPAYRVGVVLKALNSQHWREVQSGMERAAEEQQVELLLLYPRTENDEAEQRLLITDLLQTGELDALIVSPCNSGETSWMEQEAQAYGVPLFMVDTRATDRPLPYIGADNRRIGELAADYLLEQLPEGAEVAVIAGSSLQSSHNDRVQGFTERLQQAGGLRLASVTHADSDLGQSIDAMQQILDQYPGVTGVFCTNAVMGLGAVLTQERAGTARPCSIVAVDTQDDALQAVASGRMAALVTQAGDEIGALAIETVTRALAGQEIGGSVYIESRLLTADNAKQYWDERREESGNVQTADR